MSSQPSFKEDPIESNPDFVAILREVDEKAEANLLRQGQRPEMGFCHSFWREKKRLLKELHGIDWKSPWELNPDVIFD